MMAEKSICPKNYYISNTYNAKTDKTDALITRLLCFVTASRVELLKTYVDITPVNNVHAVFRKLPKDAFAGLYASAADCYPVYLDCDDDTKALCIEVYLLLRFAVSNPSASDSKKIVTALFPGMKDTVVRLSKAEGVIGAMKGDSSTDSAAAVIFYGLMTGWFGTDAVPLLKATIGYTYIKALDGVLSHDMDASLKLTGADKKNQNAVADFMAAFSSVLAN